MSEIKGLNEDVRPHSRALHDAIYNSIQDIAIDNMTCYEVLGVLDVVSKQFYEGHLGGDNEA